MHVVKKPETVVRAVGVYEWTGAEGKPTASRLVPVTLFIDGHLEDAGVYLARPVPFALDTGTIFELDQAGVPEGTLEVSFARHMSARNGDFDDGWMGFGPFKELPKPKLVAAKKSGPLSKIVVSGGKADSSSGPKFSKKPDTAPADDSGRPTMRRKTDADSTGAGSTTASSTPSTPDDPDRPTMKRKTEDGTASTGSTTTTASTPADDADRPTMKRKTDTDSPASTGSTGAKTDDSDATSDVERPTLRKRTDVQRKEARKEHDASSVRGVGSLNDDPDRPTLHRGKSAGNMGEDDLPALVGLPADMRQKVAVSDAANRAEHNFSRSWLNDAERDERLRSKLQAMAREKLAAYNKPVATARGGCGCTCTCAGEGAVDDTCGPCGCAAEGGCCQGQGCEATVQAAPAELKDEVVKGYTLSYGGDATYFYSATEKGADGVARYVSVVAQQQPGFDLRVALASVTDARHLDRDAAAAAGGRGGCGGVQPRVAADGVAGGAVAAVCAIPGDWGTGGADIFGWDYRVKAGERPGFATLGRICAQTGVSLP